MQMQRNMNINPVDIVILLFSNRVKLEACRQCVRFVSSPNASVMQFYIKWYPIRRDGPNASHFIVQEYLLNSA